MKTCWSAIAVLCVAGMAVGAERPDAREARWRKEARFPVVDLSRDAERQVVIAEGTPTLYQGHPTTTLMPDGTILATTYIKYRNDPRRHSVVCTRFRLEETDGRLGAASCTGQARPTRKETQR
jgi:hypothetical protein